MACHYVIIIWLSYGTKCSCDSVWWVLKEEANMPWCFQNVRNLFWIKQIVRALEGRKSADDLKAGIFRPPQHNAWFFKKFEFQYLPLRGTWRFSTWQGAVGRMASVVTLEPPTSMNPTSSSNDVRAKLFGFNDWCNVHFFVDS